MKVKEPLFLLVQIYKLKQQMIIQHTCILSESHYMFLITQSIIRRKET